MGPHGWCQLWGLRFASKVSLLGNMVEAEGVLQERERQGGAMVPTQTGRSKINSVVNDNYLLIHHSL